MPLKLPPEWIPALDRIAWMRGLNNRSEYIRECIRSQLRADVRKAIDGGHLNGLPPGRRAALLEILQEPDLDQPPDPRHPREHLRVTYSGPGGDRR